jgi:hypothetical protein
MLLGMYRILIGFVLSFMLVACWVAPGKERVSTPEERAGAELAINTAETTGKLSAEDAAYLRDLVAQSKDNVQSWQAYLLAIGVFLANQITTRATRGPSRKAEAKKAQTAQLKALLAKTPVV